MTRSSSVKNGRTPAPSRVSDRMNAETVSPAACAAFSICYDFDGAESGMDDLGLALRPRDYACSSDAHPSSDLP